MRRPLISVIIPTYNLSAYLGEAIRSVLEQDYPEVELIVVDDGSTDDTKEVLTEFSDRLRWCHQANAGYRLASGSSIIHEVEPEGWPHLK